MIGATTALCGSASAQSERGDLDLLGSAASSSFYAGDHFQCLGYSRRAAQRAAQIALGKDFNARFRRAAEQLELRYGKPAVEERTTLLPIGYKITPERCRKVRHIVQNARSSLTTLERRLEGH
jgi:hypothetical protein